MTFSTFGPDTLKELRAAFAGVDRHAHVSRFTDMHDIGDMLVGAGFADPVMHMEMLTLTYADVPAMLRDLKAIGATNATNARPRATHGPPPLGASARRARRDAARRTDSGDLRGDLRPRVEGRADAYRRRARDRAFRATARLNSRAPGASQRAPIGGRFRAPAGGHRNTRLPMPERL